MAGVDILNQFPSSKMAAAVKVGQSQIISVDGTGTTMMAVEASQAKQQQKKEEAKLKE